MRIAAAQAAPVSGDVEANVATAAQIVREAAEDGVALVVLPELFLCGYDLEAIAADPDGCTTREDDPRIQPLKDACRETGTAAIVGAACESADGARTISALLFARAGEIVGRYDKQHLARDERPLFTPGDGPLLAEIDGWRIGVGICFDVSFPEHARALAVAGADVYAVPAAYPVGGTDRRAIYLPARALENTVYVVFANQVGDAGTSPTCGHSAVYGPDGALLADAGPDEPGLAAADLDREQIDAAREYLTMLADLQRTP